MLLIYGAHTGGETNVFADYARARQVASIVALIGNAIAPLVLSYLLAMALR